MASLSSQRCVMIVAGEASGDLHGAKLVEALRAKESSIFFCGIGGDAMEQAGVRILTHAAAMAVVGITEVVSKIPVLYRSMSTAKRVLKSLKPELLILIDFPDFNIHLAGTAKRLGIPVLYYISPQIWAWRSGRVKKIGRRIDHMAVILPFEEAFYKNSGVPATFVGHPLMDGMNPEDPLAGGRPSGQPKVLGLVPGSRDREVTRHLPVMAQAAIRLLARHPDLQILISCAPTVPREFIEQLLAAYPPARQWEIVSGGVHEVLTRSDLIVAASGTVTLEATIQGTPMVIIYRTSPLSYLFAKALVRVKYAGLVNLIAGKELVPELIQGAADPGALADTVSEMLDEPRKLERMRSELLTIRRHLGGAGASNRVADIALTMLNRPTQEYLDSTQGVCRGTHSSDTETL